jgi:uncharacterized protein (TIGR02597 family)
MRPQRSCVQAKQKATAPPKTRRQTEHLDNQNPQTTNLIPVMKPLTYAFLAAAAACGLASAETAYTVPVGYVTLDVPANSDTHIGQPLVRSVAFQGTASSVSGSDINVPSGSGLTVNQFVYAPPAQPNSYYVLVIGGALNGRYFDVVSNTATSITVDNGSTDISSVTSFKVIPYWTLGTLFPSGSGVGTTGDIFEPNGLVQFKDPAATGLNRPATKSYFHYTGTEEAGTGWYDNDNVAAGLQDDLTIDPYLAARVRNFGAFKQVVVTGVTPDTSVATPVVTAAVPTDNYLSVQFPVDLTLGDSGLSSVLTPSTDIFEPIDLLLVYNETAAGINKPTVKSYFYYTGTEEAGTGWYDNDNVAAGLQDNLSGILVAGRTYTIRKPGGTPSTNYAVATPGYQSTL